MGERMIEIGIPLEHDSVAQGGAEREGVAVDPLTRAHASHTVRHCGSCGAAIFWVHGTSGKANPLDAAPVANGNIVIRENLLGEPVAYYLGRTNVAQPGEPRFVSHFATCPQAAQHRRAR